MPDRDDKGRPGGRAASSNNLLGGGSVTKDTAIDRIVRALESIGTVRQSGGQFQAQCPAHEDRAPSLSVRGIDGQALVYCHAGCRTDDIMAALKMGMADLYDDRRGLDYRYPDGRVVHRTPDKRFRQSGNTQGRSLYRAEQVRSAVADGRTVYVVEGEKDVSALESVGAVATCSAMGAGKWDRFDHEPLRGASVVVVADRDEPGRRHADQVRASLVGVASDVRVVEAITGKDAADHIAAGHRPDQFVPVAAASESVRRKLTLTPASEIRTARASWMWDTAPIGADPRDAEGRIPIGGITIVAGRAGIGKSQFSTFLVSGITNGTLLGEFYGRPRSVVIAASEDSWSMTIVPRLMAAGADLTRVYRVDVEEAGEPHARLTLPTDLAALADALRDHDVALVVCDPLLSMLSSAVNDYRAAEVRTALEPLAAMAEKARCAVVGLAHFTKAAGTDPLLAISGSAAFGQVIRAAIGFARDESGEQPVNVLSTVKSNLGREDLPSLEYAIEPIEVTTDEGPAWVSRFVLGSATTRSVRDVMRESTAGAEGDHGDRREAVAWLTDYIEENGSCTAAAAIKAAAQVGISKTTLTRARKAAGVASKKDGMAGGWVWTRSAEDEDLPKNPPEETEESTHGDVNPSVPSMDSSAPPPARRARQCACGNISEPDSHLCWRCAA